jgi:hypothetical protein
MIMKKQFLLVVATLCSIAALQAQDKFFTKSGKITFFSKAPLESIEAHNKSVTCVLDTKTGNLQFAVLMKGFEFEKALMQEHFNENYVESHKFPKAEFKGQVVNSADINFSADGSYPAVVKGKLTIKGESKDVETTGTIQVKNGKMLANADFIIELADYKIEIPKLVKDNISKTVKISVDCSLDPLKG